MRAPAVSAAALLAALVAQAPAAGADALSAAATPVAAVRYFPADSVNASFARGGVLLREGNYMIHTSRRVEPGKVEVHTLDTDLIYVQRGSAQFVTGGTLADGAPIAPDEIRGTTLTGGTERTLAAGDVVVVPHGVPHWFKAVSGTFLYYTIKVR